MQTQKSSRASFIHHGYLVTLRSVKAHEFAEPFFKVGIATTDGGRGWSGGLWGTKEEAAYEAIQMIQDELPPLNNKHQSADLLELAADWARESAARLSEAILNNNLPGFKEASIASSTCKDLAKLVLFAEKNGGAK